MIKYLMKINSQNLNTTIKYYISTVNKSSQK